MSIFNYTRHLFTDFYLMIKVGFGRGLREAGLQIDQAGSVLSNDIAYLEPASRHRNIMPLYNKIPVISPSAYIAPSSTVYGDVFVGKDSYFSFGSVAKGDINAIRIGENTKIG